MTARNARPLDTPGEREEALGDLEALLFAAGRAMTLAELARRLCVDERAAAELVRAMEAALARPGRGLQLREAGGRWRLETRADRGDLVTALGRDRGVRPLSPQALETLAVVALRQPVTSDEIARTRGAESHGPLQTLARQKLIAPAEPRAHEGRAARWRTTRLFLERFGLRDLAELHREGRLEELFGDTFDPAP